MLIAGLSLADTSLLQEDWAVVNDTVMGGVSSSTLDRNTGILFSGALSLDNNGGFVSMRTQATLPPLIGTESLLIEASSDDGNVYQVVFWLRGQGPRLYYKHDFKPSETPLTLRYDDFTPTSYGRQVVAAPLKKQLSNIMSIGILMGDKQEGPFALQLTELAIVGEAMILVTSDDMKTSLSRAVERGVPHYNKGDAEICAAIYQTALEDILLLRLDELSKSQQRWMKQNLETTQGIVDSDRRAWAYRRIIDDLLAAPSD